MEENLGGSMVDGLTLTEPSGVSIEPFSQKIMEEE